MNEIDRAAVDKVFEALSRSGDYTVPAFQLALCGDIDPSEYVMYIPKGFEEEDEEEEGEKEVDEEGGKTED